MEENIQITWKVNKMECYPEYNGSSLYVFNVSWKCLSYYNGVDGGPFYGEVDGSTSIPTPDGSSSFTPYDQLSENQVLDWVFANMPNGEKESFETLAKEKVLNQINPPIVIPPNPWQEIVFPITAPYFETQPPKQITIWSGQNTYIAAGINGQPFSYQWKKNSEILSNATGEGLLISGAQIEQAGTYTLFVSNPSGSAESSGCNLIINPPTIPEILDHPLGKTVRAGSNFVLNTRASGYPKPSYQWMFNDMEIPDATKEGFLIKSVQENNAGNYKVKIYNIAGSVESDVAALVVEI